MVMRLCVAEAVLIVDVISKKYRCVTGLQNEHVLHMVKAKTQGASARCVKLCADPFAAAGLQTYTSSLHAGGYVHGN